MNERRLSVDVWKRIKAEYIAGGTSYRKLAEKHNVSFTTLSRVAQRENWSGLRQQADDRATTKIVDVVTEDAVDKATKINDVADKLIDKIYGIIEHVSSTKEIKNLTSAIKDLKEIKGYKSEADMREQEARIAKLRKEAEDDKPEDREVNVTFMGDIEEYSK